MADWSASWTRPLDWVRAGYPQGMPHGDYVTLLGILSRRLTAQEIDDVARGLARGGLMEATDEQIAATIKQALLTPPRVQDINRVGNHLAVAEWTTELEQAFRHRDN